MWGWITDCFIRLIAHQMQRKLLSILHLIFGKCGLLVHLARWIFHSAESTRTAIIRWFQAKAISGRLYGCEHLTRIPQPCFLPTSQDRVKTVKLIYCFSGRWTDLTPIGALRRGAASILLNVLVNYNIHLRLWAASLFFLCLTRREPDTAWVVQLEERDESERCRVRWTDT